MNPKVVLKEDVKNFFSHRKFTKETEEFGLHTTYIFMVGLIGFLLIYYVWILNVNATQWYNIISLEKEKRDLEWRRWSLEVKIAELERLWNLKDDDRQDMEKVENPDYLVIKDGVQYVYNY